MGLQFFILSLIVGSEIKFWLGAKVVLDQSSAILNSHKDSFLEFKVTFRISKSVVLQENHLLRKRAKFPCFTVV